MPEVTVSVAPDSPVPIYRQIVDQIRLHVERGSLTPGDPLPSVRSLATQLGVHFNTVAESYRELAAEGWIELRQGRRAVVWLPASAPPIPPAESDSLCLRLRHLLAEMRLKGVAPGRIEHEVNAVLQR